MSSPGHPMAVTLLQIPAWAYAAAVRVRNRYYDQPRNRRRVDLPVISVGNLTWGGTGKTPIVAWLARHLLDQGRRPAIVSRGYGGRAGRGPLAVSAGQGPRCDASECGDEPYLLAKQLAGVSIYCGSDRYAGAAAARLADCDVVILDDGYQHRRLFRDLDILLLDATAPFGNGRVIPAGTLREPRSGLARADVVLLTRSTLGEEHGELIQTIRVHNKSAPILLAGHRASGFVDRQGEDASRPPRALAFCGIGNPQRFRLDLQTAGTEVVEFHPRRDHQAYRVEEIELLARAAERAGAALVTTEKDMARLSGFEIPSSPRILAYRINAEIFEPAPLIQAIREVVGEVQV